MTLSRALVRLLSLLVVAIGLVGLAPLGVAAVGLALGLWVALFQRDMVGLLAQRIWRMRWFFIAIAILYGLGSPLADPLSGWLQGAYRVAVLIVLVTTVAVCLHRLPPRELSDGLARLLLPLRLLGMPVTTFARRMAATLDAVNDMSERVRALPRGRSALLAVARICDQAEGYEIDVAEDEVSTSPARRDVLFLIFAVILIAVLQWQV